MLPIELWCRSSMIVVTLFYLGLFWGCAAQAPGDGDAICTDEVVDGMENPFFRIRPTYSTNERPLMDSRDYAGLLQGGDNTPWQRVDNDNNNPIGIATAVSREVFCHFSPRGSVAAPSFITSLPQSETLKR